MSDICSEMTLLLKVREPYSRFLLHRFSYYFVTLGSGNLHSPFVIFLITLCTVSPFECSQSKLKFFTQCSETEVKASLTIFRGRWTARCCCCCCRRCRNGARGFPWGTSAAAVAAAAAVGGRRRCCPSGGGAGGRCALSSARRARTVEREKVRSSEIRPPCHLCSRPSKF